MDRRLVSKELKSIAALMMPRFRKSRLLSRHEKLLDKWAETSQGERELSKGFVSYDDLPSNLRSALERVKDTETLWSDVERYLGDIATKKKFGSKKAARELKGKAEIDFQDIADRIESIVDEIDGHMNVYQRHYDRSVASRIDRATRNLIEAQKSFSDTEAYHPLREALPFGRW